MNSKEKLSGESIVHQFGASSEYFEKISGILDRLFATVNFEAHEDFKNWQHKFSLIYNKKDCNQDLFISHTYLSILIRLILIRVVLNKKALTTDDLIGIIENSNLDALNLSAFEQRFGAWPFIASSKEEKMYNALMTQTKKVYETLIQSKIQQEDLFHNLYQDVISSTLRHSMGEFYTPPYLAKKMIEESYEMGHKVLDPSCGSGTFLIELIKHIRSKEIPLDCKISAINNLFGFDLNPFAVFISKINIFLILRDDISKYEINVVLRDSLFPKHEKFEKNFDLIIGNPPWLTYSSLESLDYQNKLKLLVEELRIKPLPKNILNLDLSAVFFYQCSELYLKNGGKIFFVITSAIITGSHNDRFRTFRGFKDAKFWLFSKEIFNVDFTCLYAIKEARVETARREETAKFEIPAEHYEIKRDKNMIKVTKTANTILVPYAITEKNGKIFVKKLIEKETRDRMIPYAKSYYYDFFHKGADLNPRNLIFITTKRESDSLSLINPDRRIFKQAKAPWNRVEFKDQIMENEYIFKCVKSTELVKYNIFQHYHVFLPLNRKNLSWDPSSLSEHASSFYDSINKIYLKHKKSTTKHNSLMENLNRWGKLVNTRQLSAIKVVFNNSGSTLNTAVLEGDYLITGDLSLYATDDIDEAYYLVAILNSPIISEQIKIRKSSRHIFKKALEFPIEKFDKKNEYHGALSKLGRSATKISREFCEKILSETKGAATKNKIQDRLKNILGSLLNETDEIVKKITV